MLQSINLSEIQKLNVLPESDVMKTYNHRIYTLQDGDIYIIGKGYFIENQIDQDLIENNYYDYDFKNTIEKGKNENKQYQKFIKYLENKNGYIMMSTSDKSSVEKELERYEKLKDDVENGE